MAESLAMPPSWQASLLSSHTLLAPLFQHRSKQVTVGSFGWHENSFLRPQISFIFRGRSVMVTMSCSPPTLSMTSCCPPGHWWQRSYWGSQLSLWMPWISEPLLWTSFLLFSYSVCFLYFPLLFLLFCVSWDEFCFLSSYRGNWHQLCCLVWLIRLVISDAHFPAQLGVCLVQLSGCLLQIWVGRSEPECCLVQFGD